MAKFDKARLFSLLLTLFFLTFAIPTTFSQGHLKSWGDIHYKGENWSPRKKRLNELVMAYGRIITSSDAFTSCINKTMSTGYLNYGPYMGCKNDPFTNEDFKTQVQKVIAATRTRFNMSFFNQRKTPLINPDSPYYSPDESFNWSKLFDHFETLLDKKLCADSPLCLENPRSPLCSSFSHGGNCRQEGDPWPYAQGAGLVWHYIMHHHGYRQGTRGPNKEAKRACGIPEEATWNYSRNTIPYIVDFCINHVIDISRQNCPHIPSSRTKNFLRLSKNLIEKKSCEFHQDPRVEGLTIKAVHSQQCLDVENMSLSDKANIQQFPCNKTGAQSWSLEPLKDESFLIKNRASGKCLTSEGPQEEANIVQSQCKAEKNQLFKIKKANAYTYNIISAKGKFCLNIAGNNEKKEAKLIQYFCHGGRNQEFQIEGSYSSPFYGQEKRGMKFTDILDRGLLVGIYGRQGDLVDSLNFQREGSAKLQKENIGGNGGEPFQFRCPKGTSITGFKGRSGDVIDQIQVLCGDSKNPKKILSPLYGGKGGTPFEFICRKGEYISRVQATSSDVVTSLRFSCRFQAEFSNENLGKSL